MGLVSSAVPQVDDRLGEGPGPLLALALQHRHGGVRITRWSIWPCTSAVTRSITAPIRETSAATLAEWTRTAERSSCVGWSACQLYPSEHPGRRSTPLYRHPWHGAR